MNMPDGECSCSHRCQALETHDRAGLRGDLISDPDEGVGTRKQPRHGGQTCDKEQHHRGGRDAQASQNACPRLAPGARGPRQVRRSTRAWGSTRVPWSGSSREVALRLVGLRLDVGRRLGGHQKRNPSDR